MANLLRARSVDEEKAEAQPGAHRFLSPLLLGLSILFLLVNALALYLAQPSGDSGIWWMLLVWAACAVIGGALLRRSLPNSDPFFFPISMFLSGWGILAIERVAPNFAQRQIVWLVVAVIVLVVTASFPRLIVLLRNYRYTLLFAGIAVLVITILFGSNPSGIAGAPALWLNLGDFFIQPSEPLKIILVVFLSSYLAEQYSVVRVENAAFGRAPSPRMFGPVLLMWGVSVIVLVWQRDLGTAALFFLVFLTLLYVASGQIRLLLAGGILALVAGAAAYVLFGVVRLRVDAWINPWPEADNRAYQIVQSLMAVANGGVMGQGIGQGSPTYIPVVHSDFIFAALAEEWGLIGVVAVLFCFALIITRSLRSTVSLRPFPALLGVGLSALLAIQTILIIGGVLKVVPLTGVTVPFMSYGGSSLVTNFLLIGLMLRLSAGEQALALSA
ncbi:MAG: FtsW/RodA/SpoVE family cell cycle protein [Chloroflexi bacterium]|nr:FtsW/RodA/SpoVE family cell cycle protein [Chloroflexota bacterium]